MFAVAKVEMFVIKCVFTVVLEDAVTSMLSVVGAGNAAA
jgi:hypothetical protein